MPLKSSKTLSCFVDESGDFGKYDSHCPYYMVTVVLHDQSISLESHFNGLEQHLSDLGYPHHAIHAGPLVRRESDYIDLSMEDRKRLFNILFNFTRQIPIHFICVKIKKSECQDARDLNEKLIKAIRVEIEKSKEFWNCFDNVIIYYDNGQKALSRVLNFAFKNLFSYVAFRKVRPADYRLFQVADMICTLELTLSKIEMGLFSNTEKSFFHGAHEFKKMYWRKIKSKEMTSKSIK